jgi:hypothetical protein
MSRKATFEDRRFCVTDDPKQVIGSALDLITNNRNRALVSGRLAPDGDGFTLDTLGTVTRVYTRDELPEPWNENPSLDPGAPVVVHAERGHAPEVVRDTEQRKILHHPNAPPHAARP